MKKAIFTTLLALLLSVGTTTSAQTIDLTQNLSVTQNPERPRAYETVSIAIESYLLDLNSATISWSVDGKLLEKGTGNKTFKVKLGAVGTLTTINLSIQARTGESIEKTFRLRPAEIDILWEAETYTPPFYKGKAIFSNQSRVRIIAVPNFKTVGGKSIPAGNLIYKWEQDNEGRADVSGFGRSTFLATGPLLPRPTTISVEATTQDGELVAKTYLTLKSIPPTILFYENNPLYGIMYHRALSGSFTLPGTEITLAAEPYFFSGRAKTTPETNFDWKLNDISVGDNGDGEVTLRNDNGKTGEAVLTLEITNSQKIYQSARKLLNLKFTSGIANPTF